MGMDKGERITVERERIVIIAGRATTHRCDRCGHEDEPLTSQEIRDWYERLPGRPELEGSAKSGAVRAMDRLTLGLKSLLRFSKQR